MTKFVIADYQAEQRAEARATSDMFHHMIGALAYHAAHSPNLDAADLRRILFETEAFGNEARAKEGLADQWPISRAIAKMEAL